MDSKAEHPTVLTQAIFEQLEIIIRTQKSTTCLEEDIYNSCV